MPDDRLALTVEETAQRLGLSRKSLYAHIAAGRLPFIKLGRRRLIPVESLERWLCQQAAPREGAIP
ncbi:MAG TPA: helix-turn-helix domain-containing protein [Firmicutes bacterium]|nr:helix-turn-helix domain-containing protein [Bacillota bacterium]